MSNKPSIIHCRHCGNPLVAHTVICPYCGERKRDEIVRYEGVWFRLRCSECGEDYKVRCRTR